LPSDHPALECQYCCLTLPSWEKRVQHVAWCQFNSRPVSEYAYSFDPTLVDESIDMNA
jgi:hypothetical protein